MARWGNRLRAKAQANAAAAYQQDEDAPGGAHGGAGVGAGPAAAGVAAGGIAGAAVGRSLAPAVARIRARHEAATARQAGKDEAANIRGRANIAEATIADAGKKGAARARAGGGTEAKYRRFLDRRIRETTRDLGAVRSGEGAPPIYRNQLQDVANVTVGGEQQPDHIWAFDEKPPQGKAEWEDTLDHNKARMKELRAKLEGVGRRKRVPVKAYDRQPAKPHVRKVPDGSAAMRKPPSPERVARARLELGLHYEGMEHGGVPEAMMDARGKRHLNSVRRILHAAGELPEGEPVPTPGKRKQRKREVKVEPSKGGSVQATTRRAPRPAWPTDADKSAWRTEMGRDIEDRAAFLGAKVQRRGEERAAAASARGFARTKAVLQALPARLSTARKIGALGGAATGAALAAAAITVLAQRKKNSSQQLTGLAKRTPGAPLTEAEHQQRVEAANARWDRHSPANVAAAAHAVPMLDRQREADLLSRMQAGEPAARNTVIAAHMRMATSGARKLAGYGLPVEDLTSAGLVGLLTAADRYDPAKGDSFAAFAKPYVYGEQTAFVLRNWSIVRGGSSAGQKHLFFRLRSLQREQGDGADSEKRIATKAGVSQKAVSAMDARLLGRDASLNQPAGDEDAGEWQDNLAAPTASAEEALIEAETKQRRDAAVTRAFATLTPRQKQIIVLRWGDKKDATLAQIGATMGVSAERVRQLEAQAIGKLRAQMQAEGLHKAAPDDSDPEIPGAAELAQSITELLNRWQGNVQTVRDRNAAAEALKPVDSLVQDGAKTAFGIPNAVLVDDGFGGRKQIQVRFDMRDPQVADRLRAYRFKLAGRITSEAQDAIRDALVRGAEMGLPVDQQARIVRESIGLAPNQALWVQNFRSELEDGRYGQAQARALRDRRYDRTLERAAADGTGLSPEQIDKMVAAYARRALAYRAMTIARTEALSAANFGALETVRRVLEANQDLTVEKRWIATTTDNHTRYAHQHMNGQTVIGLETPFKAKNKDGTEDDIRWPHDEDAPARAVVNCRCTMGWRLMRKPGAGQLVAVAA